MKPIIFWISLILSLLAIFILIAFSTNKNLTKKYKNHTNLIITTDRHGEIIAQENTNGTRFIPIKKIPKNVQKKLLEQEDQQFFYHSGVNLWSLIRASWNKARKEGSSANSTLTQQLVKNLLSTQSERTLSNKLKESWGAITLEIFNSKQTILTMYANSIYLGNQAQGLEVASQMYFDSPISQLTKNEVDQLIKTIPCPTSCNPFSLNKVTKSQKKIKLSALDKKLNLLSKFEAKALCTNKKIHCQTTLDVSLNEQLRKILQEELKKLQAKKVAHGSIVVLDKSGEILALVGSQNPRSFETGQQINMALEPRPIGSTSKPLLFALGFDKGLRPYSNVEDREYKYITGGGFDFFPKNYDHVYHGLVNLHYSLSNSLNVPAVKVLEYIEIPMVETAFEELNIKPRQPLSKYQLSIALGGLELTPLQLAQSFLPFVKDEPEVFSRASAQLVNRILTDTQTRIDQFGSVSPLTLRTNQLVAIKTGTSRAYHDSWTVGYTPDFVVVTWIGNANDTSTKAISGAQGAGRVWSRVFEIMLKSEYNKRTPFNFSLTEWIESESTYGLINENPNEHLHPLVESANLILSPHARDTYLYHSDSILTFKARQKAEWYVDEILVGNGEKISWKPPQPGKYKLEARTTTQNEVLVFTVSSP